MTAYFNNGVLPPGGLAVMAEEREGIVSHTRTCITHTTVHKRLQFHQLGCFLISSAVAGYELWLLLSKHPIQIPTVLHSINHRQYGNVSSCLMHHK